MARYTLNQKITVPESLKSMPRLKGVHPVALEVLVRRGITTPEAVEKLFSLTLDNVVNSVPLKDTERAVARLIEAITRKEHIIIYRDYDCDGCCAGAIAVECLRNLGAKVSHYCNDRVIDGYGMSRRMIDVIVAKHEDAKLIVTVDNGIVAFEQINYAISCGLDVIVTDHHTPSEELPKAVAIVDPKRGDEVADFRELCGAGVIFKVMLALYKGMDLDITPVLNSLDLVALATVADVMPLVEENRVLVQEGIAIMLSQKRPFFKEFLTQKKISKISAHGEIGFQIAPLVNAVSRMEHDTTMIVDAFLTTDPQLLEMRVADLISLNESRKALSNTAEEDVVSFLEKSDTPVAEMPCILVIAPTVGSGLVGIVAGRLTEEHNKISGVFHGSGEDFLKGSMRGVDGFHIKFALDKITPGLLAGYGGHSKAAGLTLKKEHFQQFVTEFTALVVEAFPDGNEEATKALDFKLSESDCTVELLDSLALFEPYGEGFPPPLFGIQTEITKQWFMGENDLHVKYVSSRGMNFLHWRHGSEAKLRKRFPSKFVGMPEVNEYNGTISVQFNCEYEE